MQNTFAKKKYEWFSLDCHIFHSTLQDARCGQTNKKKIVEKKVCLISVIFAKVEGKTRETGKKKSPAALMTTTLPV